jgi:hypothetical protein
VVFAQPAHNTGADYVYSAYFLKNIKHAIKLQSICLPVLRRPPQNPRKKPRESFGNLSKEEFLLCQQHQGKVGGEMDVGMSIWDDK